MNDAAHSMSKLDHVKSMTESYGPLFVSHVDAGYRKIQAAFRDLQDRGIYTKGQGLHEAIKDGKYDFPELLSAERLDEIASLYNVDGIGDALLLVWYLIENVHDERQLMPAISIDRTHGTLVVRLIA